MKTYNSRIIHKHDTEFNWMATPDFIPMKGELIIYDIDNNHSCERFKIGDGITKINDLLFQVSIDDVYYRDELNPILNSIDNTLETKADVDNVILKANARAYIAEIIQEYIKNNGIGETTNVDSGIYDIPKIYITGEIPSTKDEIDAKLKYISKAEEFDCYIKIKCQGNSSMAYPKKNFTIKLYVDDTYSEKFKVNINNWGEQNKFVLKANWIDYSHARNIVSARLWSQIVETRSDYNSLPEELRTSPNNGAVDGFPVTIYCNGIYHGRYTFNIPKDKWLVNMDDDLDTHCILASENYVSGCFRTTANIDGTDWTDEIHDTVPETIKTSFNNAINFVMNSTDEEFVNNIENYFNLPSLIDYYIFSYVICHLDGLGKNQLMYTYDGIHWIASAYDMDSTFGLYWDGASFVSHQYKMQSDYETGVNGTSNLLYDRLKSLFSEQITTRYNELRASILNEIHMIREFEAFTDLIPPYKCQEDYATTTAYGAFNSIPSTKSNNIGQIREYIVKRLGYVDSKINSAGTDGTVILRENFMPMGQSWIDEVSINLNEGDYIEASINFTGCQSSTENVLSVGNNINIWGQTAGYHCYYFPAASSYSSGSLQINALINGNHNRQTVTISYPSEVIIRIDSTGFYVDGVKKHTLGQLNNLNTIQIGSMEGTIRSKAIYNYIKVVRGTDTYSE